MKQTKRTDHRVEGARGKIEVLCVALAKLGRTKPFSRFLHHGRGEIYSDCSQSFRRRHSRAVSGTAAHVEEPHARPRLHGREHGTALIVIRPARTS